MSRDRGDQCSGVVSSSFVIAKSWRLKDHSRWVFRKNSSSPLDWTTYLYYLYKWLYTTSPQSHVLLECSTITWPCHVIWLLKFPCYLYLVFIVWLDICNQVFECMGNFFLLRALITPLPTTIYTNIRPHAFLSILCHKTSYYIITLYSPLCTTSWNNLCHETRRTCYITPLLRLRLCDISICFTR